MDDNEAANTTGALNGSPAYMYSLEIEEEMESLVYETGEFNVVSKLTLRKKSTSANGSESPSFSTQLRGILRTRTTLSVRNALLMGILGCFTLVFVRKMNTAVETFEHHMEEGDPRGIHQSSFGGLNNIGQPAGAKAHPSQEVDAEYQIFIPYSNVGQYVTSLSAENRMNYNGHYWHDPNQSPFASHLYNRDDAELAQEQKEYEAKMASIKDRWGAWDFEDPFLDKSESFRPSAVYDVHKYRDLPLESFPPDAWQTDKDYVGNFTEQAKKLVQRAKEGIYAEFGHGTVDDNGKQLSSEALTKRNALFQVIVEDFSVNKDGQAIDTESGKVLKGVAYLSGNAWEGLVHKLLHAIITTDDFFVVLAGDGATAGHGNNFMQSSAMVFHFLMEPVFSILGMRLVTRNMAMSDASTTFSSLGGADIYGESDIMWFSGEIESEGQHDLLHKQAILSGDRVPIILTPAPGNIAHDSNGQAWVGNLQPGSQMCEETTKKNWKELPPACQFVNCKETKTDFCDRYNSVCWVDRLDKDPPTQQDKEVKHDGYPGYHTHYLEGRKMSLLVLNALEAALDKWADGVTEAGFPLQERYWHIGATYETIRENVRTFVSPKGENKPACESLFSAFPIVCHVEMHAFTEWTPRVSPNLSGFRSIFHPEMMLSHEPAKEAYHGIDVLPPQWKVPSNQVDVHAIAIATTAPEPVYSDEDDDDNWDDANDYTRDRRAGSLGTRRLGENAQLEWGSRLNKQSQQSRLEERSSATASNEAITPGQGWTIYKPVVGFCDGSAQSTCNRSTENTCLMAGHNDFQSGYLGDALSGWLMLRVQNVKEGIILARLDTTVKPDIDTETNGWTKENQGNGDERKVYIPGDFEFDYAINGKIKTLSRVDFGNFGEEITNDLILYPLMMNETMSHHERDEKYEGETVEVAMRIRSSAGRDATILLSHIYYA